MITTTLSVIVVAEAAGVLEATFDATIRTCRPATDGAVGAAANVTRTICWAADVVVDGRHRHAGGQPRRVGRDPHGAGEVTRSSTRSIPPAAPCRTLSEVAPRGRSVMLGSGAGGVSNVMLSMPSGPIVDPRTNAMFVVSEATVRRVLNPVPPVTVAWLGAVEVDGIAVPAEVKAVSVIVFEAVPNAPTETLTRERGPPLYCHHASVVPTHSSPRQRRETSPICEPEAAAVEPTLATTGRPAVACP